MSQGKYQKNVSDFLFKTYIDSSTESSLRLIRLLVLKFIY